MYQLGRNYPSCFRTTSTTCLTYRMADNLDTLTDYEVEHLITAISGAFWVRHCLGSTWGLSISQINIEDFIFKNYCLVAVRKDFSDNPEVQENRKAPL